MTRVRAILVLTMLAALAPDAAASPLEPGCTLDLRDDDVLANLVAAPGGTWAESLTLPPTVARAKQDDRRLPWIWEVLRRAVYARMPRYDQPREFSMVLSPVVVAGSFDTIPGVGVAGEF
jgi:hypothetical protein